MLRFRRTPVARRTTFQPNDQVFIKITHLQIFGHYDLQDMTYVITYNAYIVKRVLTFPEVTNMAHDRNPEKNTIPGRGA